MRNNPFDQAVLRQMETENIIISQDTELRLQQKLRRKMQSASHPAVVRKPFRLAPILIAALILVCGTALAVASWGSRSLITHKGIDGQEQVNEALASHVQPIKEALKGDALSANIVDAIFDGNALVTAWTVTNNTTETIYLLCDIQVNQAPTGMGTFTNGDEVFIQPGETIHSGFSARVAGGSLGTALEKCDVGLTFTAFTPKGQVVEIGAISESTPADEYHAPIEALVAQGKIPVAPDGGVELGTQYNPAITRIENLEASGLMKQLDTLYMAFTVKCNAQDQLKKAETVEKNNDTYTLRVTKADVNLNSATFHLERVFESQSAAREYESNLWDFYFLDETGDIWWASAISGDNDTKAPQQQADGTYVWAYTAEMTNLKRIPKSITVMPARFDQGTQKKVLFPKDAVSFALE